MPAFDSPSQANDQRWLAVGAREPTLAPPMDASADPFGPLVTRHLVLSPLSTNDSAADFLPVFNSNPDFVEASEGITGRDRYSEDEVALYLWQERMREHSIVFAIRHRDTGEVIGILAALVPGRDDGVPWIGLLVLTRDRQRSGMGREAAAAFEASLRRSGAARVGLHVMTSQPGARRFWESLGHVVIGETTDSNGRPVWQMEKELGPSVE